MRDKYKENGRASTIKQGHDVILMKNEVLGDVSMDKELSRHQPDDLIRWNTRVAATNPKILHIQTYHQWSTIILTTTREAEQRKQERALIQEHPMSAY